MTRTGVRVSAVIIKEDKILLIHRKKNGEEYWVFPGGGVEEGETSDQAIVREVKEETNLDVSKHELAFMCLNELDNKEQPFYYCEVSNGKPEIVGEEKDKNNADNWYHLEWIKLSDLEGVFLVPIEGKKEVIKRYLK